MTTTASGNTTSSSRIPLGLDPVEEWQPATAPSTRVDTDISLEPVRPWDLPDVPEVDTVSAASASEQEIGRLSDMLSGLRRANEDRMRGRISGDVAAQIRTHSAEGALASGIGGDSPAARALQARDFGLTSMDIQERGLATEQATTSLQQGFTALLEQRSQFRESLADERRRFQEQSRQFGASLEQDALRTQLSQRELGLRRDMFNSGQDLEAFRLTEQSRQFGASLSQDALRTQIAHRELLLRQDMFNQEQNVRLVALLSDIVSQQSTQQITALMSDKTIGMDAINASYDSLIRQIGNILGRSNPAS